MRSLNAKRNFPFVSFSLLSPIDSGGGDIFLNPAKVVPLEAEPFFFFPHLHADIKTGSLSTAHKREEGDESDRYGGRETCRRDSAGRHSSSSHDGTSQKRNKRNTNQIIKGRHFFFFFWASFLNHLLNCESHRIIWVHPCQ